jgi:hypothetical protein
VPNRTSSISSRHSSWVGIEMNLSVLERRQA